MDARPAPLPRRVRARAPRAAGRGVLPPGPPAADRDDADPGRLRPVPGAARRSTASPRAYRDRRPGSPATTRWRRYVAGAAAPERPGHASPSTTSAARRSTASATSSTSSPRARASPGRRWSSSRTATRAATARARPPSCRRPPRCWSSRASRPTAACAGPSPSSRPPAAAAASPARARRPQRLGGRADAVLVLGDMAGDARRGGPFVVPFSNGRGQAPVQLQRTVQRALHAELGTDGGAPRALTQWARMAVPVDDRRAGPVPARRPAGGAAVGHRRAAAGAPTRRSASARLTRFGRAALRVALRAGQLPRPRRARARRPRHPRQGAARLGGAAARRDAAAAAAADGDRRARARAPPPRADRAVDASGRWPARSRSCSRASSRVLLAKIGLISVAPPRADPGQRAGARRPARSSRSSRSCWSSRSAGSSRGPRCCTPRGAARARRREPDAPGAVIALGLTTVAIAAALWVGNPYAAALALPAAHLWLWALTPDLRWPRAASLAIVAARAAPARR